jgi:hypothetical protein
VEPLNQPLPYGGGCRQDTDAQKKSPAEANVSAAHSRNNIREKARELGLLLLILLDHGGEFVVLLGNTDELLSEVRHPNPPSF